MNSYINALKSPKNTVEYYKLKREALTKAIEGIKYSSQRLWDTSAYNLLTDCNEVMHLYHNAKQSDEEIEIYKDVELTDPIFLHILNTRKHPDKLYALFDSKLV